MKICGLQKTTLLDYPGHVAATVFFGGCNFKCPFCHNSELLETTLQPTYSSDEVLAFLKTRAAILEGVCITGGEPTIQSELECFIREIHSLGLKVKLDTNGYIPDRLKELCATGMIHYVAMDIKSGFSGYAAAAGVSGLSVESIKESVDFLIHANLPHEFRTTAVRELHGEKDFEEIGKWLYGCEKYYLQSFLDSGTVLTQGLSAYTKDELLFFLEILKKSIPNACLRGIDY